MADSDHAHPNDPSWLKFAFKELDRHIQEKPGAATNKRIEQYLQSTKKGSPGHESDETLWCSAFVNFCIEESTGLEGTNDLAARSWLNWNSGKRLNKDKPTRGCIVVFARPSGGSKSGHVGFYLSGSRERGIRILGGNQSNAVSIVTQPLPFLGYIEPEDDMNVDELLKALESPRGQAALRRALMTAPGKKPDAGSLFSKVADIQGGVDRVEPMVKDIKTKVQQPHP
jgi:uncharacterized protein (TIGR02594 family)